MQENMMGKRHTGNTGADKPKGHEGKTLAYIHRGD